MEVRSLLVCVAVLAAALGVAESAVSESLPPRPTAASRDATADRCFVAAAHGVFLDRDATEEELGRWSGRFAGGEPTSRLPAALATSDEWLSVEVTKLYRAALDRGPDDGGQAYWVDQLRRGATVNKVGSSIYGSPEFYARAGGTDLTFVRDLYRRILGRTADADGATYWASRVPAIGKGRVAESFFGSIESRRGRVAALYLRILGRSTDVSGRDYWAAQLLRVNDVRLAVQLASSPEFYTRAQKGCAAAVPPLEVTTTSLPPATVDVVYTAVLRVVGGEPPYRWTASGAPPGIQMVGGTLVGTPTQPGVATVTVTVADAAERIASRTLSLTVAPASTQAPSIVTSSLPNATAGVAYSVPLQAMGGTGPLEWSIAAGSLPAGLRLAASSLEGVPTASGTSTFTLKVADQDGRHATAVLSIVVAPGSFVVEELTSRSLRVGHPSIVRPRASGGTEPYRWSSTTLPPGLWIAADSGTISGTPTSSVPGPVTITATDARGVTATTVWNVVFDDSPGSCGSITTDTTWAAGRDHWLCGPLRVEPGATLTIQAGATIRGTGSITVAGMVRVAGTAARPVTIAEDVLWEVIGPTGAAEIDGMHCERMCHLATAGQARTTGAIAIRDSVLPGGAAIESNGPVEVSRTVMHRWWQAGPSLRVAVVGDHPVVVRANTVTGHGEHGPPPQWVVANGIEVLTWSSGVQPVVADNTVTDVRGRAIVVVARALSPEAYTGNTATGPGRNHVALGGRLATSATVGGSGGAPVAFDAEAALGGSGYDRFPFSSVPWEEITPVGSWTALWVERSATLTIASDAPVAIGTVGIDAGATVRAQAGARLTAGEEGAQTWITGAGRLELAGTAQGKVTVRDPLGVHPTGDGTVVVRHATCIAQCSIDAHHTQYVASTGTLEVTDSRLNGSINADWAGAVTVLRSHLRRDGTRNAVLDLRWGGVTGAVTIAGNHLSGLDRWGTADQRETDGIRLTSWARPAPAVRDNVLQDIDGGGIGLIARDIRPSQLTGNTQQGSTGRGSFSIGGVLAEDMQAGTLGGLRTDFDAYHLVSSYHYWGPPEDRAPDATLVVPSDRSLTWPAGAAAAVESVWGQAGSTIAIGAGATLAAPRRHQGGGINAEGALTVSGTAAAPVQVQAPFGLNLGTADHQTTIDHLHCHERCSIGGHGSQADPFRRSVTLRDSVVRGAVTFTWTVRPIVVERTHLRPQYRDGGLYVRADGAQGTVTFRGNSVHFTGHEPDRCHPPSAGVGASTWWPGIEPVVEGNDVRGMSACEAYIITARRIHPSRLTTNTGSGNARNAIFVSGYLDEDLTLPQPGLPIGRANNYLAAPLGWPTLAGPDAIPPVMEIIVPVGITLTLLDGYQMPVSTSHSCSYAHSWCVFGPPAALLVIGGRLIAHGTPEAPVSFDPGGGAWGGIGVGEGGFASFRFADLDQVYGTALGVGDHSTVIFRGRIRNANPFTSSGAGGISSCGPATPDEPATCYVDARYVDWGTPTGPAPHGDGPSVCGTMRIAPWAGAEGQPFSVEAYAPYQCRHQQSYLQMIQTELENLCAAVEDCDDLRTVTAYAQCYDAITRAAIDISGGGDSWLEMMRDARPEWSEALAGDMLEIGIELAKIAAGITEDVVLTTAAEVAGFMSELLSAASDLARLFATGSECRAAFDG